MKGYLLDTHLVLWLASDPSKVGSQAMQALLDSRYQKYVSIISAWEIALKIKIGKLELEGGVDSFFIICEQSGLQFLNIKKSYIKGTTELPFLHRDPFDRMLIATALEESLTLLSADSKIHKYSVPWLW